jgi:hypothetical protein
VLLACLVISVATFFLLNTQGAVHPGVATAFFAMHFGAGIGCWLIAIALVRRPHASAVTS